VEARPLRNYTEGALVSHLLGYMGSIPADELADYAALGYQPSDLVGLTGIELTQEDVLRGVKGQKHVEVDVYEREVNVIASDPATPGNNIILTVDTALQQVVQDALEVGMREAGSDVGVAIVMDPRNGQVLSMVTLPAFDNNLFSGGISYDDFASLNEDPRRPLVNHAVSGQYPPGSTFKVIPATAELQDGVITTGTMCTCRGVLLLPNKYYPDDLSKAQPFYCWNRAGHGTLNVVGALANSCNIFFYQATGGYEEFEGLGIDRLGDYMRMFGFGEPTGIELSGEASGLVPNDRWKRQNYGESWTTGDTYNAAIGQGFVLSTPLQLLNATVAIANGAHCTGRN
jgi:penicillin-binding protein 2